MRLLKLCWCLAIFCIAVSASAQAERDPTVAQDVPGTTVPVDRLLPTFPFKSPAQARHHGDRLYVLDEKTHRILVFGPDGSRQAQIGEIGSGKGEFFDPSDFQIVGDRLFVLDSGNRRVQVLDLEGRYLSEFPELPNAKGFAVNSKGEVLLGQPQNGSLVSVYDAKGELLRSFGTLKTAADLWDRPVSDEEASGFGLAASRVHIAVDDRDDVYVSYVIGPLLEKYSSDGEPLFSSRMEGPEIDRLEKIFWDEPTGTMVLSSGIDGIAVDLVTKSIAVGRRHGKPAVLVLLGDDSIFWAGEGGERIARLEPQRTDPKGWFWRITPEEGERFFLFASIFASEVYRLDLADAGSAERR